MFTSAGSIDVSMSSDASILPHGRAAAIALVQHCSQSDRSSCLAVGAKRVQSRNKLSITHHDGSYLQEGQGFLGQSFFPCQEAHCEQDIRVPSAQVDSSSQEPFEIRSWGDCKHTRLRGRDGTRSSHAHACSALARNFHSNNCSKEVCVSLTRGGPPDGAAPREEIVFNECNRKSCEVRALANRVQRCEVHI